jgi:hypothetical protein
VRPFGLDLLDAEGQVVRGRGKGVRYLANDIGRVVLQVFEWVDEGVGAQDAALARGREPGAALGGALRESGTTASSGRCCGR